MNGFISKFKLHFLFFLKKWVGLLQRVYLNSRGTMIGLGRQGRILVCDRCCGSGLLNRLSKRTSSFEWRVGRFVRGLRSCLCSYNSQERHTPVQIQGTSLDRWTMSKPIELPCMTQIRQHQDGDKQRIRIDRTNLQTGSHDILNFDILIFQSNPDLKSSFEMKLVSVPIIHDGNFNCTVEFQ